MTLTPGYGETPVPAEELDALADVARETLGNPVTKFEVYDFEQAIAADVFIELLEDVLEGSLTADELMSDIFLRELHRRLYADVWTWAGKFRKRELNIGVAPEQIAVELRSSIDNILYRWQHTSDWTPRELGVALHAETVRIHPFIDGNGRVTRLFADLVFVAVQDAESPQVYDWQVENKVQYIELLQQYDRHRDPSDLCKYIQVRTLA